MSSQEYIYIPPKKPEHESEYLVGVSYIRIMKTACYEAHSYSSHFIKSGANEYVVAMVYQWSTSWNIVHLPTLSALIPVSILRFPGMRIPRYRDCHYKGTTWDHLIFILGIPILLRKHLYIERYLKPFLLEGNYLTNSLKAWACFPSRTLSQHYCGITKCSAIATHGQWSFCWWCCLMMTSSNGNIFRVTGHLCGKFTGPRWISRTKASDAELWCFLWFTSE